jgi:hypothetical protein
MVMLNLCKNSESDRGVNRAIVNFMAVARRIGNRLSVNSYQQTVIRNQL